MTRHVLSDAEWTALKARLQSIGGIWKHGSDKRNRRFLQAVYYLLRTGLAWVDLPDALGNADTVRKRFRRWCKSGIWQRLFDSTVPAGQLEKLMLDGTICKAHRYAAGARGGAEEDIGRSRGGRTTKIGAAVCATTQKVVRVVLAPGQRHDCVLATAMLGPVEGAVVIADKAFDTDPFRCDLAANGCTAVIPSKENRRHPKKLNKALYRWRHGIENVFARMKDFIRITLRRDKTSASYLGFLHLACAVLNIQRDACLAKQGSLCP
jgi:transposase